MGPTSECDAAAAGHTIVPFADSRRRPPPHSKRSSGGPLSSRPRTIADEKTPIRGSRKQTSTDPPAALSDCKGCSRKKTMRTHSSYCHGEELIVGFPKRKPNSHLGMQLEQALRRSPQAGSSGARLDDTDCHQTPIDWGDEDDIVNSKTTSLNAASCNESCNQSVELDSSTRLFLQSFSSLLSILNQQVANQSA